MNLPARIINQQAELRPVITMQGDRLVVDSQDVARQFDRPHKSVLYAIDTMLVRRPELLGQNFLLKQVASPIGNGATRETRAFDMDRDGFSLLVMGFTGEKALNWKLAYIQAFNAMEAALRARTAPAVDLDDNRTLRRLLLERMEREDALVERLAIAHTTIEAQAVTVEAHERLTNIAGGKCVSSTAKRLGVGPMALFAYMRNPQAKVRWLIKRSREAEDEVHQDRINAQDMISPVETIRVQPRNGPERDKDVTRILVTPKGLGHLARLIVEGKDPLLPVPVDMLAVLKISRGDRGLFD